MITFASVAELEEALRAAEKAHQVAELKGSSNAAHWAPFYALHMAMNARYVAPTQETTNAN